MTNGSQKKLNKEKALTLQNSQKQPTNVPFFVMKLSDNTKLKVLLRTQAMYKGFMKIENDAYRSAKFKSFIFLLNWYLYHIFFFSVTVLILD